MHGSCGAPAQRREPSLQLPSASLTARRCQDGDRHQGQGDGQTAAALRVSVQTLSPGAHLPGLVRVLHPGLDLSIMSTQIRNYPAWGHPLGGVRLLGRSSNRELTAQGLSHYPFLCPLLSLSLFPYSLSLPLTYSFSVSLRVFVCFSLSFSLSLSFFLFLYPHHLSWWG